MGVSNRDDFHKPLLMKEAYIYTYVNKITKKTKMTDEELKEINDKMATRYNAKEEASECYKFEGTITFTGSKFEDPDPISTMKYCNYNGAWYLIGA